MNLYMYAANAERITEDFILPYVTVKPFLNVQIPFSISSLFVFRGEVLTRPQPNS